MSWPVLEDLARLPVPGTGGPGSIAFTPDATALTYLQAEPGSLVQSLWHHDLASGERVELAAPLAGTGREELLSHREQLERERTRSTALGVTEYAWLTRAPVPTLLVPMGGLAFVAAGDETRRGARPVPGVQDAARVIGSPEGTWAAFVRDDDIWVAALAGGEARRLTTDAGPGISNGLAEYAASEELDRHDGLWWSCDGRHIAYARVDERGVPPLAIAHLGDAAPFHEEHRYPFAGGPNALVRLRIAGVDGGETLEAPLPMAADDYLARVVADPTGGWLVAVLPRDQRSLAWHHVDVDGRVRPLWTEEGRPWINLDDDTRVLEDGHILRTTERHGFRHLELRAPGGELRGQLTGGDWMVTGIAHVDERSREVFFGATADGATERHLYRAGLDERRPVTRPQRMTDEPGWHEVVFSRDGTCWVDRWSDLGHAPRVTVHARESRSSTWSISTPGATADTLDVRPPELMELRAADGSTPLHAALYRPGRPAGEPPPCVVWVYGGPHAQYVKRAWETTAHPLRQYLARAGVAVLAVDGRGSAFRGLEFEAPLAGALGSTEVGDQAAAVRQLADRGEIDAARVGITGGSYGGFITIRAMALEPELFRVGVAVAPVTSWDAYDTAYTERYLGRPDEGADAYAASSALGVADRITGSLLVIHGAIDENVHLRHSVRLVAALQSAGRDVELVLLPGDRHRVRTAAGLRTRDRRTARHLLEGLGVPLPPDLLAG